MGFQFSGFERNPGNVLPHPGIPVKTGIIPYALLYNNAKNNKRTNNKCIKLSLILFHDCVKNSAFTGLSPSRDLSFVANYPAAENSRSASTDVGGMLHNALNSCSNLLGLFSVFAFQMSKRPLVELPSTILFLSNECK